MIEKLKALWHESGDPNTPVMYEDICDASSQSFADEVGEIKIMLIASLASIAFLAMSVIACWKLGLLQ